MTLPRIALVLGCLLAARTVPVALALFPGVFEVPGSDIAAASIVASLPPVLVVVGLGAISCGDCWRARSRNEEGGVGGRVSRAPRRGCG